MNELTSPIFRSFQKEKVVVDFVFTDDTGIPIDLTTSLIKVRMSDIQRQEILLFFRSDTDTNVIIKDPECVSKFKIVFGEVFSENSGEYFLEIEIIDNIKNIKSKTLYTFDVVDSISELPDSPTINQASS